MAELLPICLMDEKIHRVYSDKLHLYVLLLNKLEQDSEEEKQTEIYRWAKIIVTDNRKELEAMASGNQYMEAAIKEPDRLNSDKQLRYEYMRREIKMMDEATLKSYYREKDEEIARKFKEFAAKMEEFARLLLKGYSEEQIGNEIHILSQKIGSRRFNPIRQGGYYEFTFLLWSIRSW